METDFIKKHAKLITAALIAFILFGAFFPMTVSVKQSLNFSGATGALGAIFIVVLLVERVTEILISITRREQSVKLANELKRLEKKDANSDGAQKARTKFAEYKVGTKQKALFFSFTLSIIICVAGVGLLGEIFAITGNCIQEGTQQVCQTMGEWQKSYLRLVDIVLTAGLIAGGTEIFHQLFNMVGIFSGRMRESLTAQDVKE